MEDIQCFRCGRVWRVEKRVIGPYSQRFLDGCEKCLPRNDRFDEAGFPLDVETV